jgi:hypothetical protein
MVSNYEQIGRNDVLKPRFTSLQFQLQALVELGDDVSSVLEVGPGRKHFYAISKLLGYDIKTLDKYSELDQDFECDVTELTSDRAFDAVLAFEVLEHMPYEQSLTFFSELVRLSKQWIVVSLPIRHKRWRRVLKGRSPVIPDLPVVTREDHWNPHHWEVGRTSYPIDKVVSDLCSQGATLHSKFLNKYHKYHLFLSFKKTN